jgi:hypothetical protein
MPILSPPEAVAQFRYTVIAPLVSRTLAFGEQRALLEEQAAKVWTSPNGQVQRIHLRTIRRWVTAYRLGGLTALTPKTRSDQGRVRVNPDLIAQAVALREEDPHRSARQIITMLEWSGAMAPGSLCHSTLTYHFRKAGTTAYVGAMPAETFRRRQAPRHNAEWQGDYVRNRVMERNSRNLVLGGLRPLSTFHNRDATARYRQM